jgi:hypothetical protein
VQLTAVLLEYICYNLVMTFEDKYIGKYDKIIDIIYSNCVQGCVQRYELLALQCAISFADIGLYWQ